MTGPEFREYRAAAGLSVRKAAETLSVAPATIQRWQMGESPIPSEAADRIRELAGPMDPEHARARTIGRLIAVLQHILDAPGQRPRFPDTMHQIWAQSPAAATGQLIQMARTMALPRFRAWEREIEDLMNDLGSIPSRMTLPVQSSAWLGYYGRKSEGFNVPVSETPEELEDGE